MITCKRTGRQWPDEYAGLHLKTCVLCDGIIDTRHESWANTDAQPMHPDKQCPPAVKAKPAPNMSQKPPPQEKLTGRQLLERNDWYKRNILDKESPE